MKNTDILIDTNIVLDWILKRVSFHQDATDIIELCMRGEIRGYLAAHSVLNVFFIVRKDFNLEQRRNLSRLLCEKFTIIGIDGQKMIEALDSENFKDLEDGLQEQCAISEDLDYIITRDPKGFENSRIQALSPGEFLKLYKKGSL